MTDSVSPFDKQIANRNYMSPLGFKLILTKTPKVDFLCQSANIPQISMGTAVQPSYLKDIAVPVDKVLYDDLNVRFLVDEKMENYLSIYKWMTGLGYPESLTQFDKLESEAVLPGNFGKAGDNIYSDGTLQILSSNLVPKFNVNFKDLFPYSISTVSFDATDTDIEYFTADVSFKYTIYTLTDLSNNPL